MVAVQMPEPKNVDVEKAERLGIICSSLASSKTDIAARLGINQSNLAKLIGGKRRIGTHMELAILTRLNVNRLWWEEGLGEMFVDPKTTMASAPYVGKLTATDLVEVRFLSMKSTTISIIQLINNPSSLPTYPVPSSEIVGEVVDNVVFEVSSERMQPVIRDGAKVNTVKIPTGKFGHAPSPAIYMIAHKDRLSIGRVLQNKLPLNKSLLLHADNPMHETMIIPASDIQAMYRVHHVSQDL